MRPHDLKFLGYDSLIMGKPKSRMARVLDRLEKFYGKPKTPRPADAYEMVLHRNCGYPQSDVNCDKGFAALKKEIGLSPEKILAAPVAKLREVLRPAELCRNCGRSGCGKLQREWRRSLVEIWMRY